MTMTKTLQLLARNEHAFLYADHVTSGLQLVWTEATSRMTDDDHKAVLERLADTVVAKKARNVLIDARCMGHPESDELLAWHRKTVAPRLNQSVVKLAHLVRTGEDTDPRKGEGEAFLSRTMTSEDAILEWFAAA